MAAADAHRTGLVVAGHGRHVLVEAASGERLICHPRGKRNECVVGDRVDWSPTAPGSGEGVIASIDPRRNLLHREDAWRSKAFAANVDQVWLLVAVEPPFSDVQLGRALIAATAAGIPATILLNKVDLPGAAMTRARLAPYRALGIDVLEVALRRQPEASLAILAPRLKGRITLVIGPSGVGKSSLVNLAVPDAGAQVGEISRALNAGRHTTTATQWYWIDAPGTDPRAALIDTPGFQSFGLQHLAVRDLTHWMPDIGAHSAGCRFKDCSHDREPGCAVRAAVEAGELAASRLQLFQALRSELGQTRY
ncbi:MAG: ribosome small subunit-dependent GTPase A [Ideonella sp.]|nr:ribosome small subunit-dependent GTPase A [Ideonella sp.]